MKSTKNYNDYLNNQTLNLDQFKIIRPYDMKNSNEIQSIENNQKQNKKLIRPFSMTHKRNLKKESSPDKIQNDILKENVRLCGKLKEIWSNKSYVVKNIIEKNCPDTSFKIEKSMNSFIRKNTQSKIQQENLKILTRINDQKTVYNKKKYAAEWRINRKISQIMSKYPTSTPSYSKEHMKISKTINDISLENGDKSTCLSHLDSPKHIKTSNSFYLSAVQKPMRRESRSVLESPFDVCKNKVILYKGTAKIGNAYYLVEFSIKDDEFIIKTHNLEYAEDFEFVCTSSEGTNILIDHNLQYEEIIANLSIDKGKLVYIPKGTSINIKAKLEEFIRKKERSDSITCISPINKESQDGQGLAITTLTPSHMKKNSKDNEDHIQQQQQQQKVKQSRDIKISPTKIFDEKSDDRPFYPINLINRKYNIRCRPYQLIINQGTNKKKEKIKVNHEDKISCSINLSTPMSSKINTLDYLDDKFASLNPTHNRSSSSFTSEIEGVMEEKLNILENLC